MDGIWQDDHMDRKPSADFLTKYILSNAHVKVLNVNSPWGTGKSFFLERWAATLSEKHVCVRFNAWETDYSAEPLVALIACIEDQLRDPVDITSTKVGQGVVNAGSLLVQKAGPLILKGLFKKFSGVELNDLFGDGAEEATEGVVESLIKDQMETKQNVKEFKAEVSRRLSLAAENRGLKAPAFIFIDELDRCRPTYAIELLERIKHFFELDDCRFVIASDSVQLAHSIRAVYGQGFHSERYLNRFFDAEFRLDNDNIYPLVQSMLPPVPSIAININVAGRVDDFYYQSARGMGQNVVYPDRYTVSCELEGYNENQLMVVALAKCFDVGLREINNYIQQIKGAADTIGGNINFFWLAFLVFYKNSKIDTYLTFFSARGIEDLQRSFDYRLVNTKFLFAGSLESVFDLASFYHSIVMVDEQNSRSFGQNLEGWRSTVFYANCNGDAPERLRSYRKVVDLAHRLN